MARPPDFFLFFMVQKTIPLHKTLLRFSKFLGAPQCDLIGLERIDKYREHDRGPTGGSDSQTIASAGHAFCGRQGGHRHLIWHRHGGLSDYPILGSTRLCCHVRAGAFSMSRKGACRPRFFVPCVHFFSSCCSAHSTHRMIAVDCHLPLHVPSSETVSYVILMI